LVAIVAGVLTTLLAQLELNVGAQPSGEGAGVEARRVLQPIEVLVIRALAFPLAGFEAVAIRPDGRRRLAVNRE
jgi:hypothetical protein